MNGLLLIDKPGGMTSRDVVNRVQKGFPRKTKLGHTGTLDPLATGTLVICVGAATRLVQLVQDMPKTYRSRFRLGARSSTDDVDGHVTLHPNATLPDRETLEKALSQFVGELAQVPPAFSAAKLAGTRAYDLAREGKPVDLKPRTVHVHALRVIGYEPPFAEVEIDCGKGTYIRSIARDVGESLGCGGMVETLRRTRVGPFHADNGVRLSDAPIDYGRHLLPMALAATDLPRLTLHEAQIRQMRLGQRITVGTQERAGRDVALFDSAGELLGIGQSQHDETVHASVVLNV